MQKPFVFYFQQRKINNFLNKVFSSKILGVNCIVKHISTDTKSKMHPLATKTACLKNNTNTYTIKFKLCTAVHQEHIRSLTTPTFR